ncbi:hypothetical protein [Gilvimarinus chinensis]|uniref:hypothetical protein n=1 Tax=Gilvimarinus chinensis TaxID=396005 RepID=UPI00037EB7FE|nr:hypothetical protein [Gilvimarinus chinensis]
MEEYEFVYISSEYINRSWDILQFWVGITFGLLAISQLAVRRLNAWLLLLITLLYIDFSILTARLLKYNREIVSSYMADLNHLPELSAGTRQFLMEAPRPLELSLTLSVAYYALFIGTVIFCWYSYLRLRVAKKPDSAA